MRPIVLGPNGVPRFYLGGAEIARLRGVEPAGDRVPEDWVGSTTTVFGDPDLGLSRLPDGRLLRDAITADPVAFLGPAHADRFGGDPALLVKLLDAGERLPVHLHPDGAFAQRHLGTRFGKTEAWIVLATTRPDTAVHLGFRDDVDKQTLRGWVAGQDHDALLGSLNPLAVKAGDAVFVPAGTPHAIGAGLLIAELQEPSDMSVLLEWEGFGISDEDEATLGLGWDVAMACVDRRALDPRPLVGPAPKGPAASLLPPAADRFFAARRLAPEGRLELAPGFAILIVTEGEGRLSPAGGETLALRRGDTVLVPFAAGACVLEGDVVAIACLGPGSPT